ncbi:hypothetical protein GN244_ATG09711 [Phytophthora infestans]|uniref:Uncharacterized protein n=1 Tax=Phytophthora infestans TaxID=4787 RepID=A0A833SAI4_PHYIN|nr:hypothetical protein GN244_ATG09711 [Phytophthora infestans]
MVMQVAASNLAAAKVTIEGTKLFKQLLTENLGAEESIQTSGVKFLSLQRIIVNDRLIEDMIHLTLRAKWLYDDICFLTGLYYT